MVVEGEDTITTIIDFSIEEEEEDFDKAAVLVAGEEVVGDTTIIIETTITTKMFRFDTIRPPLIPLKRLALLPTIQTKNAFGLPSRGVATENSI